MDRCKKKKKKVRSVYGYATGMIWWLVRSEPTDLGLLEGLAAVEENIRVRRLNDVVRYFADC